MAMSRRPRPTGGRHPPPLAPSVSTFKPRSEWSNAGSSIFLYVNLPGFYRDQIQIKSDEKTRTIQIQGQRPLSTQTRARFNESYRVPETCDMRNIKTSFLHGLLTIELPVSEKRAQDQAEVALKPDREEGRARGSNSGVGRKEPTGDDEKPVEGAVQAKEEEGRARVSHGSVGGKQPTKDDEKLVEGAGQAKEEEGRARVSNGSLGRKQSTKDDEKLVEGAGQAKEEEGRARVSNGSLGGKQPTKDDEKLVEGTGQAKEEEGRARVSHGSVGRKQPLDKSEQRVKEDKGRTWVPDGSLERKKHEEGDESIGDDVARQEKEDAATNGVSPEQKTKQREERHGTLGSKQLEPEEKLKLDEEKAGKGGQIQDQAKQKNKSGEGESDEIVNVKLGLEKEEAKDDEELREAETMESTETFHDATSEVAKDQREVNGNKKMLSDSDGDDVVGKNLLQRKDEEQVEKQGMPLANVGVAALVIMGFGAYLFLPFFKLFY